MNKLNLLMIYTLSMKEYSMSNVNRFLSDYVYLAEASYADFSNVAHLSYSKDKNDKTISAIEDNKSPANFAKLVTNNYEVVAHYKDRGSLFVPAHYGQSSGFSATLFRNKNTGECVFALRGSAGGKDLLVTDAGDIVHDGLAHHQIVDMYNFWNKSKQGRTKSIWTAA